MGHPQSPSGSYGGMMRHNAATIAQALSQPVRAVNARASDTRVLDSAHP